MFGVLTSLVNQVPGLLGEVGQAHSEDSAATWLAIFTSQFLDAGWAWAALAFALGWLTRSVLAALFGLAAATVAYYLTDSLFHGEGLEWQATIYWLVLAALFGPPLGWAGMMARRPGAIGFLAALTVPACATGNLILYPLWTGLPGESPARLWATIATWAFAATCVLLACWRFTRARRLRPAP